MNITAQPGESIYSFTQRILLAARASNFDVSATHNDVTIRVYPNSAEYDILDKWNMQRTINRLEETK